VIYVAVAPSLIEAYLPIDNPLFTQLYLKMITEGSVIAENNKQKTFEFFFPFIPP
jgi:hypothetical protein